MNRPRAARVRLVLTAALLASALAGAAHLTGVLRALEGDSIDARFEQRGAQAPDDIVVVAVDDVTFSELKTAWPLPRSLYGRAVSRLHAAGAREIVLDIQFTEPTTEREDMALYDAIDRAGGAVLATSESDGRGHTNVLGGDENLRPIGARAGASNLPGEEAGVLRRFTHSMARLPTVAVVVAERRGRHVSPSAFARGGAYIDFRGPAGTIPTVSLSALLHGDVDPRVLRGKIAVVGATAPTLHDSHATAAGSEPMPGPEVQANAIWTLLHGLPLRDATGWLALLVVIAMSFVVPLLALCVRPLLAALAAPVAGAGYLAAAQLTFEAGTVLPVVAPLFGLALATVATVAASHLMETLVRQRIAERNDSLRQDVRDAELEIIQRLGRAVESRDEETGDHIDRIGTLAHELALAAGMGPQEAERLRRASSMHDVGKIAIPDSILRKPGPLDPAQRAIMQTHTTVGASLLAGSRSPLVQMAEVTARTHHERWDGTGYPSGLSGEAIPLAGRITALCDVFDALTSPRVYKHAWTIEDALAEIERESGHHFDPELTALFLALHRRTTPAHCADEQVALRH